MEMVVLGIVVLDVNMVDVIIQKNMLILIIIEIVNQSANNVHGMQTSIAPKTLKASPLPLSIIHIITHYFLILENIHQNIDIFLMMFSKKSSSSPNMEIYQLLLKESY